MAGEPAVTIITAAFNAERYVNRVTQAVLSQRDIDFEWIIVDDGSTDRTRVAFEAAVRGDPRVRVVSAESNRGVAVARNLGLARATGKYVSFLDVDDSWACDKLAVQYRFMEQTGSELSAMDYLRVSEQQVPLSVVRPPEVSSWRDMLISNRIGNLTAMVLRSSLRNIEFRQIGHEDYVFWLEVVRRAGSSLRVPTHEPMCFYTVRRSSLSANKIAAARWQWMVYREVERLGFFLSAWCFINYALHAIRKRKRMTGLR